MTKQNKSTAGYQRSRWTAQQENQRRFFEAIEAARFEVTICRYKNDPIFSHTTASTNVSTTNASPDLMLDLMKLAVTINRNARQHEDEELRRFSSCTTCGHRPHYDDRRQLELCESYYQALRRDQRVEHVPPGTVPASIGGVPFVRVACVPLIREFDYDRAMNFIGDHWQKLKKLHARPECLR